MSKLCMRLTETDKKRIAYISSKSENKTISGAIRHALFLYEQIIKDSLNGQTTTIKIIPQQLKITK